MPVNWNGGHVADTQSWTYPAVAVPLRPEIHIYTARLHGHPMGAPGTVTGWDTNRFFFKHIIFASKKDIPTPIAEKERKRAIHRNPTRVTDPIFGHADLLLKVGGLPNRMPWGNKYGPTGHNPNTAIRTVAGMGPTAPGWITYTELGDAFLAALEGHRIAGNQFGAGHAIVVAPGAGHCVVTTHPDGVSNNQITLSVNAHQHDVMVAGVLIRRYYDVYHYV